MIDLCLYGQDVMVMMSLEMIKAFGYDTIGDRHVESFMKGETSSFKEEKEDKNYYYADMVNSQEVRLTGPQTTLLRGTRLLSEIHFLDDTKGMAYVYSDVIEYSTVGDINTPLLDVVPLVHRTGTRETYELKHPRYVPIRLSSFDRIRLTLRDRRGEPFDFIGDFVLVALHIGRRRV